MAENLKVFVSSSMSELKAERELVASSLKTLGIASFVYEHDAGARPMSIEDTYVKELEQSDIYVGIFWKKYGEYTIDEYNKAKEFQKPRLIYQKQAELSSRDPQLQDFLNKISDVTQGDVAPYFFYEGEELPERIKDDVLGLLTDALRGQNRSPGKSYDDLIEPTQLPCLCDRTPQERQFRKGLIQHLTTKSTRPGLVVLGGQRQDGHRLYVTRLELRSLLESLALAGRRGKRKVVILPDPLTDTSSPQALSDELGMMLASKLRVTYSPNHKFLLDYIKNEQIKTLVISLTVTSTDYRSGLREPLTTLYDVLASYQDLPDDLLIGYLVCVQRDGTEQLAEQDIAACRAIHVQRQKVYLLELPLLETIKPDDVARWLGLPEVKRHLPSVVQHNVDELFPVSNELRMEELFGKLQGLIARGNKA